MADEFSVSLSFVITAAEQRILNALSWALLPDDTKGIEETGARIESLDDLLTSTKIKI